MIIINFENDNKFKRFLLRSLDTNRAEIRYRFRCSRTAPEIHLELASRTVRLRTFISGKRGFRNIFTFLRENVIYYPFKFGTSEIAYFSSSCFRLSCAFSISVIRTFLNAALIEKKQRNRKKYSGQKPISNAIFESRKRTRFLVIEKRNFKAQYKHVRFMAAK